MKQNSDETRNAGAVANVVKRETAQINFRIDPGLKEAAELAEG
jgi:hypothetical protein